MHPTENFHQIGVHPTNAGFEDGAVAHVADELIHFNACFFDDFFNAGGMDPSVRDQGFDGFARDFTAHRIESR